MHLCGRAASASNLAACAQPLAQAVQDLGARVVGDEAEVQGSLRLLQASYHSGDTTSFSTEE